MREVAVVGVSMIRFGRYDDVSLSQLGARPVLEALKDAGMELTDIEAMYCGCLNQTSMTGQAILKEIGATGIPVINVANACATGSTAFRDAYLGIAAGAFDTALAVGVEKMGRGLLGAGGGGGGGAGGTGVPSEGHIGSGLMPAVFAQAGVEHMRKYGTTVEQFAKCAAKNHKHSVHNPYSQYQADMTVEDVLNARMVAWPNTLYMCCPTGDGAAAAILCSMDKARQLTTKPIKVAASALTSDPYSPRNPTMWDFNLVTRNAANAAYEQAGLGPKDLDLVELHDCFSTAEILHYENLGLCGEGEAGALIDSGETYVGGRTPVNASGGLVSKGHPLGATGVANIAEVVWHLRGQAGNRQVEDAKVGLAHVVGLGSACTVHILTA
jgi:acetyl-CoA acyltransferase